MSKFCVWRTHQELTEAEEKPAASFYSSREAAEEVADKWRKRDRREVASYTSHDDHHIPIIQDRLYCVRGCDERDEYCPCREYVEERYNGQYDCVETPGDSWDDHEEEAEPEPRRRFLGIF